MTAKYGDVNCDGKVDVSDAVLLRRIIVEDNGPGYVPPANEEVQFALDNIRERLKTMCGGTLEIVPREEGGTRVTVFIPSRLPATSTNK